MTDSGVEVFDNVKQFIINPSRGNNVEVIFKYIVETIEGKTVKNRRHIADRITLNGDVIEKFSSIASSIDMTFKDGVSCMIKEYKFTDLPSNKYTIKCEKTGTTAHD